jgi:hypothetical protein
MNNLLNNKNTQVISSERAFIEEHCIDAVLCIKPDVDVSEWITKSTLKLDENGQTILVQEPGYLVKSLLTHSHILIADIDRADETQLKLITQVVEANPNTQFAFTLMG